MRSNFAGFLPFPSVNVNINDPGDAFHLPLESQLFAA